MGGILCPESVCIKGGNHCGHREVSFINEKIKSCGGATFVALEIRTREGMSKEIAVTIKNKKMKLSMASLINRTV